MCSLTLKHTTGLVAFFMSGATAFCQSDALALSSGATTPGGTVSLNLSLSSPSGSQPAGIEWTFVYLPSDIFAISASAGAAGQRRALTRARKVGDDQRPPPPDIL